MEDLMAGPLHTADNILVSWQVFLLLARGKQSLLVFTHPNVEGTWEELLRHTRDIDDRTCQVEEGHDAPFLDRKILQAGHTFDDGHVRYGGETAG